MNNNGIDDVPNLMGNALKSISSVFGEFGEMMIRITSESFNTLQSTLAEIITMTENLYGADIVMYKKLGKLGWDFSDGLPIDYIIELVKYINANIDNDQEINNLFIGLYENDCYELLIAPIETKLYSMDGLRNKDKLLHLLGGAYVMYEAGNYDASVCLLTPLIEGIFSDKIEKPNKAGIVNELSVLGDNEKSQIIIAQIIIVKEYIGEFLKYADFNKAEPDGCINRHWVAHGRSYTTFEKIDCLRLLCMIQAALNIVNFCYGR